MAHEGILKLRRTPLYMKQGVAALAGRHGTFLQHIPTSFSVRAHAGRNFLFQVQCESLTSKLQHEEAEASSWMMRAREAESKAIAMERVRIPGYPTSGFISIVIHILVPATVHGARVEHCHTESRAKSAAFLQTADCRNPEP